LELILVIIGVMISPVVFVTGLEKDLEKFASSVSGYEKNIFARSG